MRTILILVIDAKVKRICDFRWLEVIWNCFNSFRDRDASVLNKQYVKSRSITTVQDMFKLRLQVAQCRLVFVHSAYARFGSRDSKRRESESGCLALLGAHSLSRAEESVHNN